MVGLHRSISLSFMLVGHTKFAPDWCFGLLKQKFRRTFVSSLDDLEQVVNTSADCNYAQLVGTQDGEVVVPMYSWSTHFEQHFRKLPGIKKYQHYTFSSLQPGKVTFKEYSDSESCTFNLLTDDWNPSASELPPVIMPTGLSLERQWYLYNEIREFCRTGTDHLVCPCPTLPQQCQQLSEEEEEQQEAEEEEQEDNGEDVECEPRAKRARKCGRCGSTGHNRRTCTVEI